MNNAIRSLVWLAGAAVLFVTADTTVFAQQSASLVAAKNDCLVGEGADGYLHVRSSDVSDEVRREVESINLKRKAAYTDLADENNITVEVAAALTAEKLVQRAKAGQCILTANGTWTEVN